LQLESSGLDRQVMLDILIAENNARLDNINRKIIADTSSRQAVLNAQLEHTLSEQTARTDSSILIYDTELIARRERATSAEDRANNRAITVQEASNLRSATSIVRMEGRISDRAFNVAAINETELAMLVGEFNARLQAVNIRGDSKLLTSEIIDMAKINNDIAISSASISSQKEISIANTDARENNLIASSESSNIRLEGSTLAREISLASSSNIRASEAYSRSNIDFMNTWSAATIAVENNVQHTISYSSSH